MLWFGLKWKMYSPCAVELIIVLALVPRFTLFCDFRATQICQGKAQSTGNGATTADQLFTSPLLIDKRLTTLLGKRFFQNSVVITPKGLEALCYQVVGDARMEKPFGSQLQANF